ncbi:MULTISPECIES: Crp/Fnr family transcriptional regulator [Ferrimonas]|uniref:Crp/Fnr family transcriptional regulator n=1 Tax=Ferrimonas TaxID=44011 RepID=UPI0004241B51|nr:MULTISPECIES: Crp/Fnr family transcriptional regulator [Ferrimonas]USD35862.1 Crp/Fnr family transcriptional regulator [Ferrimonas sp. SCSIO 43195]
MLITQSPHTDFSGFATALGLSPSALQHGLSRCQPLELESGSTLLAQGETQQFGFFLMQGVLRACHYSSEGEERCKEFYFPGELCFLYASWLDASPALYQIETLTAAKLLKVPLSLLDRPDWQVLQLPLLRQQLLYKEQKEALFLLHSPEERYLALTRLWPHWNQVLSQAQLARYIGISPISLSRIKRRINLG